MRNFTPNSRRSGLTALTAVFIAAALTACSSTTTSDGAAPADSAATEVTTLVVGSTTSLAGTGVRYAISSGAFEEAGLTVTATPVKSGNDAVPQLISGDLQVAQVDTTTALQAIEKGVPIQIIAAAGVQSTDGGAGVPSTGSVLVLPDSPIQTPADLAGVKLGVPAINNQIWMNIRNVIDQDGGDSSRVEFIEVPGPQAIDLLVRGDVDATTASEPLASATVAAGTARLIHSTDVPGGMGEPSSVYIATTEFISENPQTLSAFVDALYTAQDAVNNDKSLGITVAVEQLNYTQEQLENAFILTYGTTPITADQLSSVSEKAVEYGILTEMPDASKVLATIK